MYTPSEGEMKITPAASAVSFLITLYDIFQVVFYVFFNIRKGIFDSKGTLIYPYRQFNG